MTRDNLTPADADRLELLDRIAERLPELDLKQRSIEWATLDDGARRCSWTAAGSTAVPASSSPTPARTCTQSAACRRWRQPSAAS